MAVEYAKEREKLISLVPMDELCECCDHKGCSGCQAGEKWRMEAQNEKEVH